MISSLKKLGKAQEGAAAIEMAIAFPVLITMIYGIFSFGQIMEAEAGIQSALGEGARYATLCLSPNSTGSCTVPSSTQIKAKVNSKLFGTSNGTFDTPTIDTSTASSGYVTITVTYHQAMSFAFYTTPSITFTRSKRVYLADTPGTQSDCSSGASTAPSCAIYS